MTKIIIFSSVVIMVSPFLLIVFNDTFASYIKQFRSKFVINSFNMKIHCLSKSPKKFWHRLRKRSSSPTWN